MKFSLGISNFLEEISSLSHSIVFLCFFALIGEEGFLISPCYYLKLCIQMGISFLFSFAFRFSSFHSYLSGLLGQPFCFFAFLSLEYGLLAASCTMSWTSVRRMSAAAVTAQEQSREELPHVHHKEQRLHFAGEAVKRYPTSKVREIPVRR